jgi:hypothetical protein
MSATRYVAEAIGPRRVGGVYRSGYWGITYRVEEIHTGPGGPIPWSEWAIVATDLDGPTPGRTRTHCTAWDPGADTERPDPGQRRPPPNERQEGAGA